MFSKFFIKDFILSQRYLFSVNSPLKLLKNNFSRINKRKSKKIDEKSRLNDKKTKNKDEKINTNSTQETANSKFPSDIPNFAVWGYGFVITGSIFLYFNVNSIKDLHMVNYEEFERDYLKRGEVKRVKLYGTLTQILSGSNIEVYLHHNDKRQFQKIAVKDIQQHEFPIKLRLTEKDLNIRPNDAVPFNYSISEGFFLVGFLLIISSFVAHISKMPPPPFTSSPPLPPQPPPTPTPPPSSTIKKTLKNSSSIFPNFRNSAKQTLLLKDEMPKIKFEDIAGLHSAKIEIKEFLDYLKNPNKFIRLGAHLPKGAMLLGPPGCGKTLLVKALAYESSTPFYYKSGPEFVESIGGLGARNIRELFSEARDTAPCIIFIDEIDSIGKKRGSANHRTSDCDQTLNQLLVEMDGMASVTGVVVFAATNRPDVLDVALLRPGRFDRHISIDLPILKEREEIFNLYLRKFENKLESSICMLSERLSSQTPGMSGADIANVCNEAALVAAKQNYKLIKDECFDSALERIIEGAVKKSSILSKSEKKIVAYHEAGHVIVSWILKNTDPILKVSIIERTNNKFGFLSYNKENNYLLSTEKLKDQIAVFLGGRAAELLIFNKLTSGAEDDLKNVRKIALRMVRNWGMSEKVGHFSYNVPDDNSANKILPYSKYTEELIDAEVSKIVVTSFRLAERILKENMKQLEVIAAELLKKEVLLYKDIEVLIGPRQQ